MLECYFVRHAFENKLDCECNWAWQKDYLVRLQGDSFPPPVVNVPPTQNYAPKFESVISNAGAIRPSKHDPSMIPPSRTRQFAEVTLPAVEQRVILATLAKLAAASPNAAPAAKSNTVTSPNVGPAVQNDIATSPMLLGMNPYDSFFT